MLPPLILRRQDRRLEEIMWKERIKFLESTN